MVSRIVFLLAFFSITFIQVQAQKQSLVTYKDFSIVEPKVLRHASVAILDPITPSSIHLLDSLVMVVDQNMDYAISFYRLKDWSIKAKYGRRGDGPAEMRKPKFHGQVTKDQNNEVYLWFSDYRTFQMKKLSVMKMIADEQTEPEVTQRLPPEIAWFYDDIFSLSDNEFIGSVVGDPLEDSKNKDAGRFFYLKMEDESLQWVPNFPKQKLKVPAEKIGYLYSSVSTMNPKTGQLASGMKFFDRFDLVDVKNNSVLTVVQENKSDVEEVDLVDRKGRLIPPKTKYYYVQVYSTENYVYLLYSNLTEQEGNDFFNGTRTDVKKPQLHVFNWKGAAVYKATLDKVGVADFFVDERTWTVYFRDTMSENEEEIFVKYKLNLLEGLNR